MGKCLLVIGMHRSGTSALAGAIERLGVFFGSPLMPPREGENPKGYFEHLKVYEFHKRLLGELRYTWDDLRSLPEGWFLRADLDPFREQLRQLLIDEFASAPVWAVKDPRLCRLAPFWLRVLADGGWSPRLAIIYRHPDEVAASLEQRNGFSAEKSGFLWVEHNLAAVHGTDGYPRILVPYHRLLEHPVDTLEQIGTALDLQWPRPPDASESELTEFLDPGLRNEIAAASKDIRMDFGRLTGIVRDLYEALVAQQLTAGDTARRHQEILVHRYRDAAAELDPLLLENISELARTRKRIDDIEQQLQEQSSRLRDQGTTLRDQDTTLREQDRKLREQDEKLQIGRAHV